MTLHSRFLVAGLAAALMTAGCSDTSAVKADGSNDYQFARLPASANGLFAVADRKPAPRVAGQTLQGADLDVGTMRGKVVVLNFWADWCGPCRAESPFLNAVATKTKASGVEFVGVDVKDDRTAAITGERVRQMSYPSIYDQPAVLLTRFRRVVPQTPPSTLLLDRRGRLAGIFNGGVTETDLTPAVLALAAEPA